MSQSIEREDNRNGGRFDKPAECDKGSLRLLKEAMQLIATFLFMILNFLLDTASFLLWQTRSEISRLLQVIKQMFCSLCYLIFFLRLFI